MASVSRKFKTGDKVRIISKSVWDNLEKLKESRNFSNWYPDFPYATVTRYETPFGESRECLVLAGNYFLESDVELVERDEVREFKVGDRVRIIQTNASSYEKYIGEVGIIHKDDYDESNNYWIIMKDGNDAPWSAEELELVEFEKPIEALRYNSPRYFSYPDVFGLDWGESETADTKKPKKSLMGKLDAEAQAVEDSHRAEVESLLEER